LKVDFSKINGVVFGLCENWGFLPVLNAGEIHEAAGLSGVGELAYHATAIAPVGKLVCNGQEVNKKTYARLYSVIGDAWATTGGAAAPAVDRFRVPPQNINAQGLFLRGNNAGVGTYQTDIIRNIKGLYNPSFSGLGRTIDSIASGAFELSKSHPIYTITTNPTNCWVTLTFDANRIVPTGGENIPANISGLLCIKY
jgi:microcystin-dependent protein